MAEIVGAGKLSGSRLVRRLPLRPGRKRVGIRGKSSLAAARNIEEKGDVGTMSQ